MRCVRCSFHQDSVIKTNTFKIGFKHGKEAKLFVSRSIKFYTNLFLESTKLTWPEVQKLALGFQPNIQQKWPQYLEEMQGLSDGAGVDLADILALNVRTEINFGLFTDGCTALSWRTDNASYLAQNWDWQEQMMENLVMLTIEKKDKPVIKFVSEAGIIGKIGLNDSGVGVNLNAIKAKGLDMERMPVHLALRLVLESTSRQEAVSQLEVYGVASACHMLIADATGGVGLEWSCKDLKKLEMNSHGQIFHANHYLVEHVVKDECPWIDSHFRIERIEELASTVSEAPAMSDIGVLFRDERNYPAAICRTQEGDSSIGTLFNIVMDLKAKKSTVKMGRPTRPGEVIEITF